MEVRRTALDDDRNVSTAVVEAVADAVGTTPLDVEPPLYRVVDPDALNDLFDAGRDADSPVTISFTYADCEVSVSGRGEIVVQPRSTSEFEQSS